MSENPYAALSMHTHESSCTQSFEELPKLDGPGRVQNLVLGSRTHNHSLLVKSMC